jgi:hypothetical protein
VVDPEGVIVGVMLGEAVGVEDDSSASVASLVGVVVTKGDGDSVRSVVVAAHRGGTCAGMDQGSSVEESSTASTLGSPESLGWSATVESDWA